MAQKKTTSKRSYSTKGSTGLKNKSKFNWRKYIPVIVLISLVGGFFVWRSFAGVKLYPYQYSVYSCSGFNNTKIKPDDKCVGESAEALTIRMYQGVLGRAPESKSNLKDAKGKPVVPGYQFWVQKLAGDRTKTNDAGNQFVAASKTVSAKSNQVFVEDLYKNMYGKKGDAKGIKYWKDQLDSKKKYTRGMVTMYFATQQSAITAQKAKVANYISTAPKVAVVQTAQKDQDVRLVQITQKANEGKKQYDSIAGYVGSARKNRDTAKSIAGKSVPSRADLTSIANQEKAVRAYRGKTSGAINGAITAAGKSKEIYTRAKAAADYSPDISADKVKAQYDKAVVWRASAEGVNKDLDNLIKEISGYYKTAEGKYEAEQQRIAEEAARRAAEEAAQGGGSGSRPAETSTSVEVPADIRSNAQKFNEYMHAACNRKKGTKSYSVAHGDAYRNVSYRYTGNGNNCTVGTLGSYINPAFCDATYTPIAFNDASKGCKKMPAAPKGALYAKATSQSCPDSIISSMGDHVTTDKVNGATRWKYYCKPIMGSNHTRTNISCPSGYQVIAYGNNYKSCRRN